MQMKNILEISTRSELRNWFDLNSNNEKECWIPLSRKTISHKLLYVDAVYEAICFGWIDSTTKKVGDVTYQRFSPRRKVSPWTELNKARAKKLIELGLMTDQGYQVLPDLNKEFIISEDILQKIKSDDEIYENFLKLPPLYVRVRLDNIMGFDKVDIKTYDMRLEKFLSATKKGILYGQWHDDSRLL